MAEEEALDPWAVERLERVARLCAIGAIALGALGLVGWLGDIAWLRAPFPGIPAMRLPVALAFLCLGVATLVLQRRQRARALTLLARLFAGAVLVGAVVALTGVTLPAGSVLASPADGGHPAPPNSILCFALLGAALLALDEDGRRRLRPMDVLACAAGFVAFLAASGYVFKVPGAGLTRELPDLGMALQTAVGVLFLSTAALGARPERGLMRTFCSRRAGGMMARRLSVGVLTIPLVGLCAALAQRAGAYPPPGAAVITTAFAMLLVSALIVLTAHSLDRSDAEREAFEEDLRHWKLFFDNASFGAVFCLPDGTMRDVNPGLARMHGFDRPAELETRSLLTMFAPEEHGRVEEQLRTLDATGIHRFEATHLRRDGSRFPALVDARAVRDDAGRVLFRAMYVQDITAAKKAREVEAQLAAIVSSASDAISAQTPDGVVLAWNRGAEEVFGWTAEEMVGFSIRRVVPDDKMEELEKLLERVRHGEPVVGLETERVRRDGRRVPAVITVTPVKGEDGSIRFFSVIARDVSAQKGAERAIEQALDSERRLRRGLERIAAASGEIGRALVDLEALGLDGVLRSIVEQAQGLTDAGMAAVGLVKAPGEPFEPFVAVGVSEAEARRIGQNPWPVGVLGVTALEGEAARKEEGPVEEGSEALPGGAPPMHSFLAVPLRATSGRTGYLYLANKAGEGAFTAEDQRMLELFAVSAGSVIGVALAWQEQVLQRTWLSTVIDQMPEAVLIADAQGKVVVQNDVAEERAVSRRVGDSLMSTPPAYHVLGADGRELPPEKLPLVAALQRGEQTHGRELLLVTPEGERVPILFSAAPVRVGGKPAGAVAMWRDMRPLKEVERLRQEWTAIIAHDLRQPVQALSLAVTMLERSGACAEKAQPTLKHMARAAARLDRMVEDLLDASRIESRRLTIRREVFDLEASLSELPGKVPGLGDRGRVRYDADAPRHVLADPARIDQVLGNLLSNALKYGAPGTMILIEVHRAGAAVEVVVTNEGRGIPASELAVLFSRFGRTREAQSGATPGIGLGLYISRGLVEAHGGRMWAESRPEGPTRFHFTLPVAPEGEGAAASP